MSFPRKYHFAKYERSTKKDYDLIVDGESNNSIDSPQRDKRFAGGGMKRALLRGVQECIDGGKGGDKIMKRLLAFFLVLAVVAAFSLPVLAQEVVTGKIQTLDRVAKKINID